MYYKVTPPRTSSYNSNYLVFKLFNNFVYLFCWKHIVLLLNILKQLCYCCRKLYAWWDGQHTLYIMYYMYMVLVKMLIVKVLICSTVYKGTGKFYRFEFIWDYSNSPNYTFKTIVKFCGEKYILCLKCLPYDTHSWEKSESSKWIMQTNYKKIKFFVLLL